MPAAKSQSAKRSSNGRAAGTRPFAGWTELRTSGLCILQSSELAKLPWLVHGFSTRPGGVSEIDGQRVLNLGFAGWDTPENVQENRKRFLAALGANDLTLAPLLQFHSDVICLFQKAPGKPRRGDASVTHCDGLLLGVLTADCVPILLVDPQHRVVAAVHAGWRGTLQRIVAKSVGRMHMEFGTRAEDLLAALGPAIGGCCYEVGAEVASAFISQFARASEWFDELRTGDEPNPLQWLSRMPPGHQPPPKKVLLDLRKANRSQLLEAGLPAGNIFVSELCTACRADLLFSYRREGAHSGRLLSVVGLRPS